MSAMVLDTRQFDKALVQYAAASKKDFADISNKRVYDISLRSIKYVKNADKSSVRALQKEEKLLWWIAWRVYMPRGMKRKEAYQKAQTLIRRRGKAVGFLKGFFRKMSILIQPYVSDRFQAANRRGKGNFAGFTPYVKPATKLHPVADVGISYDYKKRSEKTAKQTERILLKALRGGIVDTAADMMKYVDRKMGRTARKYSAGGTI